MTAPEKQPPSSGQQAREKFTERFNLSRVAIQNPALTLYLLVVLLVAGAAAYLQLGQDEDPPFTFRVMVVRAFWPGATAMQMAQQVSDPIEKTLQDAVITIQNTLEEKRKVAQQEAEAILTDARQKANDELQGSREHVSQLRAEIHVLETQKMQFFARFRSLLRSQAQVLEAMMEAEEKEMGPAPAAPAPAAPRTPAPDSVETRWARK